MDEEFVYVLEKKPIHGLNHYSNIIVKSLKGYVLQILLLPPVSFITLKLMIFDFGKIQLFKSIAAYRLLVFQLSTKIY